jgi:hypothetical protein
MYLWGGGGCERGGSKEERAMSEELLWQTMGWVGGGDRGGRSKHVSRKSCCFLVRLDGGADRPKHGGAQDEKKKMDRDTGGGDD